jgi:hypothetical protein
MEVFEMVVGGVQVGCGKNLKFHFPKTKDILILEITRKFIIVEWFIEGEKQINKCYKDKLVKLTNDLIIGKVYTVNRIDFINTIC